MGGQTSPHITDTHEPFFTTFVDIPIRDARKAMERPLFSLEKSRRSKPIIHSNYNGNDSLIVSAPEDIGLATIWDKDILMWVISQLREALDKGLKVTPIVSFSPYTLLKAIHRRTGGTDYRCLINALRRLNATSIEHVSDTGKRIELFHWLEQASIKFNPVTGQPTDQWVVVLPRWLYMAALDEKQVLTIAEEYFDIKSAYERMFYLLSRKYAGNQKKGWTCLARTLHAKTGTSVLYAIFAKKHLRPIIKRNALPDYWLELFRNQYGDEMFRAIRRTHLDVTHPGYRPYSHRRFKKLTPPLPAVPPPMQELRYSMKPSFLNEAPTSPEILDTLPF